MKRNENIVKIKNQFELWDFVVIGGGVLGLGIVFDVFFCGFLVVFLEKADFVKGILSWSIKLLYGGVCYLVQGDVFFVLEVLKEWGFMMKNVFYFFGK